jgi:hypothetical protein
MGFAKKRHLAESAVTERIAITSACNLFRKAGFTELPITPRRLQSTNGQCETPFAR